MTPNVNPKAREEGLVTEDLEDELLVYDLDRHKAHCLNSTAAAVWRRCDGKTSVSRIATRLQKELKAPVDDEVVWVALRRLGKANLLAGRVAPMPEDGFRSSRRELMKKLALAGGLSIATILAPSAAEAATGCKTGVTCKHVINHGVAENGQCCTSTHAICHISSDGNGTCGPGTCTVC